MKAHVVAIRETLYTSTTLITTHATFYTRNSFTLCGRMNVASESVTDCKHAAALLKGLNLQREFGQFCDCVIQLHISPGKLFLAHKSVLAASSPVLASLLISQGALLDLQFPCLSPETMEYLLDFIYTGTLPPKSQEDSMLSVAVDLQMQELQYALIFRRGGLSESLNIQNKLDRKRPFSEEEHDEGNTTSPSHPHRPEEPLPSCLSCEAVPVIQHASACRKLSPREQSSTPCFDVNVVSDLHRRESDSCQHVHKLDDYKFQSTDKNDDNLYEPMCKKVKVASHVQPSGHARQTESPKDFDDDLQESITVSPKEKSAQIRPAQQKEEDLCPQTEPIRSLILSNASRNDGSQRLVGNEHSVPCASFGFSDASANIAVDCSHCISEGPGQHNVLCPMQSEADEPDTVHVAISTEKNNHFVDMQTSRSSSDSKPWFYLGRCNAQGPVVSNHSITEDTPAVHESARNYISESSSIEQEDDCDLFSPQIPGVHTYQGQLRYHCLSREPQQVTESSDSEEEGLYAAPLDATSSKHSSGAGTALSTISAHEPSVGMFDLGKAQTNSVLNLASQPYQCTMCDRAFSQRGSLNRHMRSHLGVRPYACPQCPMTFSRQYRVTEHMRVHQRGCEDLQRSGPT